MTGRSLSRRGLMQGAAALGAAALIPQGLSAQQVARTASAPGAPLPARGELIIRGATVLTMDPAVPDLAAGAVHVRDGAIVAVAPTIEAPAAQVIDGAGMICIPGFVDTHFHMWNALFRIFVRADVPALGYFPVTARLGPLMQPEDSYRSVTDMHVAGGEVGHGRIHGEHGDAADDELAACGQRRARRAGGARDLLRRQAPWEERRRSQRCRSLHKPTPAEAPACHLPTSHVPARHITTTNPTSVKLFMGSSRCNIRLVMPEFLDLSLS